MTWQWQISGTVNTSVDAQVYDIDGFDATTSLINTLHGQGRRVVCYLDMGSAENYRPDYNQFPAAALSTTNEEWPDEKWIHPASLDMANAQGRTVRQILQARLEMVDAKGCDAVEPDMIEAWSSGADFPSMPDPTAGQQLTFNRWIADATHALGMDVGLKGDRDGTQVRDLEPWFDFTIQEQVYQYGEAAVLEPFRAAGKAVFIAEYQTLKPAWCTDARNRGYSLIGKNLNLGAARTLCP